MDILKVYLKNCYGIGKLEHKFDFEKSTAHSIYAGNGIMKTSFANTFLDLSNKRQPKERVYSLTPECDVQVDGNKIEAEQICVIKPYQEDYRSEKVALLIANEDLRDQYAAAMEELDGAKKDLLQALAGDTGFSRKRGDMEEKLKQDIGVHDQKPNSFFLALARVKNELDADLEKYSDIKYEEVFNKHTESQTNGAIFDNEEFKAHISSYIENYNSLLEQSHFFKKGVFDLSNADNVAKTLENKGYFNASHELKLNLGGTTRIIKDKEGLASFIEDEKRQILDDPSLEEPFNAMQAMLSKNQGLQDFAKYLSDNKLILEELGNLLAFKQKLWKSYFLKNKELYDRACEQYAQTEEAVKQIMDKAEKDQSKWDEVIKIFNRRFNVPFKVYMDNRIDAALGHQIPGFKFEFRNESHGASDSKDKNEILGILSQGELRALYLLDVIYEIKGRQASSVDTLYIIDDIADSFDYENKYAIIEYLHELQNQGSSRLIILTHNFDFHRTVSSRLGIARACRRHAIRKADNSIALTEETYQNNPLSAWKQAWSSSIDPDRGCYRIIASVAMMRELALLIGNDASKQLGKALHYNDDLKSLTLDAVIASMRIVLGTSCSDLKSGELWLEYVMTAADSMPSEAAELELEEKITLSIAIRLHTERFIINSLGITQDDITGIKKNQTRWLIDKFQKDNSGDKKRLPLVDKVAIMTPEMIHLNAFMYEPILDMSGDHLIKLYNEVKESMR